MRSLLKAKTTSSQRLAVVRERHLAFLAVALLALGTSEADAASPIELLDGTTTIQSPDGRVSLGSVVLGGTSPLKTITVRNSSTTPLSLSQAYVPSTSGFTIESNFGPNQVCPPRQTASFTIKLNNDVAGYKTGVVRVVGLNFNVTGAVTRGGIIIDDVDPGFSQTGTWTIAQGYGGTTKRSLGSGNSTATSTATWCFTGLQPGKYNVDASWFGNGSLSGSVQYVIRDGGPAGNIVDSPKLNQQYQPMSVDPVVGGQPFGRLATVTIKTNTLVIQVSNTGVNKALYVAADAMQVVPVTTAAGARRAR